MLAVEQGRQEGLIGGEEGWEELVQVDGVGNRLPEVFAVIYVLRIRVQQVVEKKNKKQ